MSAVSHISRLSSVQIDKQKWDDCIRYSGNGLIYAYSWYLDCMAPGWEALVMGDYEAVMPLTGGKKFGIAYLYQPFLTAQLGVFGKNTAPSLTDHFLESIPGKYKYIDICLNSANVPDLYKKYSRERVNYVLDLQRPYEELYGQYSDNIRRNLKKAAESGCMVEKGIDSEKVIQLAVKQMKDYGQEEAGNMLRFRKLIDCLKPPFISKTYAVLSVTGQLLSSALFLNDDKRAYYLLVGNHRDGKVLGASHALIDGFIRDHAGKNMVLDFEGSDIPGLALFYKSFGARAENYPAIKWNRLPFYLKWLKR